MSWMPAAISAGANILGGYLQGESAGDAANTSAQAQLQAARIAAEAARFRPVGITTRFGQSNFQTDAQGNLIGAGYTLTPEMRAYQDRLQALARGGLSQAEMAQQQYAPLQQGATGLFNLGKQYLAQSPEQVAANYIQQQQALLQPTRDVEMANLQNRLQQTGRTGLAVSQGGNLGAANPELQALYNARSMQDLQLAAQGQQEGQRQLAFGAGLFGTGAGLMGQYQQGQISALSPYQAYLSGIQGIEGAGQEALNLGAGLGGQAAAYGARSGQLGLLGAQAAATTMQAANAYNPLATGLMGGANALQNYQMQQQQQKQFYDYINRRYPQSAFSDQYQANIPVNNQTSSYY